MKYKYLVLFCVLCVFLFVLFRPIDIFDGKSDISSKKEVADDQGSVSVRRKGDVLQKLQKISGRYADRNAKFRTEVDVAKELQRISNLTLAGPDLNFEGLIVGLDNVLDWNIPLIVDDACLRKNAIQLSEVEFPATLEAGGVTRRSSLRFVLDIGGVAYFVDDNRRIVVTTKPLARIQWLTQLIRPRPHDLRATSVTVRREAAFSVAFFDVDPDDWIQPLVSSLEDADKDVRFDSVYALGELGPQAEASIDPLCQMLRSNDLTLRAAATNAVAKIGPKAASKLLKLIDDPDRSIALAAAAALGTMGSAGNDSVPGLVAAGERISAQGDGGNNDEIIILYHEIGSSLSMVELGDAVPLIRRLLKAENPGTRAFAAFTIGEIGPSAQVCEPELQKLLSDSSTTVRRDAAYALARLDLPSNTSTTALEAATNDPDYDVTLWAAKALRVIKSNR